MKLRSRSRFGHSSTIVSLALAASGLLTNSISAAQESARKESFWDRMTLDVNVGAPKLSSGEFKVVGDALVGFAMDNFGGAARGSLFHYDLALPGNRFSQNTRQEYSGEFWLVTGKPEDALRFELLGSGGGLNYNTDTFLANKFTSQDSWMGRGMLSAGVRLRPVPTIHLQALAGGGLLFESYNHLSTDPASQGITDTENQSFRGEGRLVAHWAFLPGILSTRLRGDGAYFTITRATDSYVSTANAFVTEIDSYRQIEMRGRLSLEVDAAALAGILPFAYAGIEYISVSSDAGSDSLTVPSAGVGLNKPVW